MMYTTPLPLLWHLTGHLYFTLFASCVNLDVKEYQ